MLMPHFENIKIFHFSKQVVCQHSDEDNAIFLTSWFINATAYAFRNKLKEMNEHYNFKMNNNGELPAMNFQVENLPDDLYGYVYVFNKTDDMIKDNHECTTQYRCYHELRPIDVVKVYYKDFADYFSRESLQKSKQKEMIKMNTSKQIQCLIPIYLTPLEKSL